jgi:hypothetical protein
VTFVKWMTCQVPSADRQRFSEAQQRWAPVAQEPGFICQIGGWDEGSPNTACILALWHAPDAHARFMRRRHDSLLDAAQQAGTYRSLQVTTGSVILDMPGAETDSVAAVTRARLLRVADCEVRSDREDHFRDSQEHIWAPGMNGADGMLGGVFSQLGEHRYLVTTGWRDHASHEGYRRDRLPALSKRAAPTNDLRRLQGYVVHLSDAWTVTATKP